MRFDVSQFQAAINMNALLRIIKRPSFWLHVGFACTVAALALTRTGRRLDMISPTVDVDLSPGEAVQVEDSVMVLKRFGIPRYASGKPKQYVSELHYMAAESKGAVEDVSISVNHPFVRSGWWIYQSSWGEGAQGEFTVLKCVRDPFLPLAFAGWAMLLAGAFALAVRHWRLAAAAEAAAPCGGCSASGIRRWWPYAAAAVLTAFPVYFIGRSVLKPDLMPALQSPLLFPHILAYLFSYVIFLFAAFGLLRRLWGVAYFLMTLGLVLGALWGKICWGEWWQFDPKEMWSLCTWLAYGFYFHVRYLPALTPDGRRRLEKAVLIAGAALVLLTLTWVNFSRLFSGLHSYA